MNLFLKIPVPAALYSIIDLFCSEVRCHNHTISILPIYVLHQTLIIVFGFYIVQLEIPLLLQFLGIALTAIPASVLIYRMIQTNNVTRFLFGLKPKPSKETFADTR